MVYRPVVYFLNNLKKSAKIYLMYYVKEHRSWKRKFNSCYYLLRVSVLLGIAKCLFYFI